MKWHDGISVKSVRLRRKIWRGTVGDWWIVQVKLLIRVRMMEK